MKPRSPSDEGPIGASIFQSRSRQRLKPITPKEKSEREKNRVCVCVCVCEDTFST